MRDSGKIPRGPPDLPTGAQGSRWNGARNCGVGGGGFMMNTGGGFTGDLMGFTVMVI